MIFSETKAKRFELVLLGCLSQISGILNLNGGALKSLAIERPVLENSRCVLCVFTIFRIGALLSAEWNILWSSMGGSSIKINNTHNSNGKLRK